MPVLNKRIRDLILQSQISFDGTNYIASETNIEQFANLIVTECAVLIDSADDSRPYETYGEMLRGKFGFYDSIK